MGRRTKGLQWKTARNEQKALFSIQGGLGGGGRLSLTNNDDNDDNNSVTRTAARHKFVLSQGSARAVSCNSLSIAKADLQGCGVSFSCHNNNTHTTSKDSPSRAKIMVNYLLFFTECYKAAVCTWEMCCSAGEKRCGREERRQRQKRRLWARRLLFRRRLVVYIRHNL